MRESPLLFAFLLLLGSTLSWGCPAAKTPEELGEATAIEAPVETTPISLETVENQIPKGIDDYQAVMVEWEGMKPHTARFERFVRGSCFASGNYQFAEGGILVQVKPLFRSAEAGAGMAPGEITFAQANDIARGPKAATSSHERSPTGALSWVWQEQPDGHERIWTITYPEAGACVTPGVMARHTLPAKMKPTFRREGPLPGETPFDGEPPVKPGAKPAAEPTPEGDSPDPGGKTQAAPLPAAEAPDESGPGVEGASPETAAEPE